VSSSANQGAENGDLTPQVRGAVSKFWKVVSSGGPDGVAVLGKVRFFVSSLLLSSVELSDTTIYEP